LKICNACGYVNEDTSVVCSMCVESLDNALNYDATVEKLEARRIRLALMRRLITIFLFLANAVIDIVCLVFAIRHSFSLAVLGMLFFFQVIVWVNFLFPEVIFKLKHSFELESFELSEGFLSFNKIISAVILVILCLATMAYIVFPPEQHKPRTFAPASQYVRTADEP